MLVEIELEVSPENVATSCLNKDSLTALMDNKASKILAIIQQRINNAKLFFTCDSTNKKELYHIIKVGTWWNGNRMINILIDSNAAAGDNMNIVKAIDISLLKIDNINDNVYKKVMYNLNTDDSKGIIKEGLAKEMDKYSIICSLNKLLKTTCYHHSFNLMIVLLCEKYFGDSSILNRNLI